MSRLLCVALLAMIGFGTAAAQSYEVPADGRAFISDNPFRLYLIQEGDTVGPSRRAITVIMERWTDHGHGFQVVRESQDLGLSRDSRVDTMTISPRGEVQSINGRTDGGTGEWDAMLRLPVESLHVGSSWTDTLEHRVDGPARPGLYRAIRTYRVTSEVDTLGHSALRVDATGTIDFEMAMWTDSVAGSYRWFDLSGPVEESFHFSPDAGQWIARAWEMELTGVGGDVSPSGSDTVPAGLRSSNRRWVVAQDFARLASRPLPEGDTLITVRNGQEFILGHMMNPGAESWEEGLTRADGTVGTAAMRYDSSGISSLEVVWTDLTGISHQDRLERTSNGHLRSASGDSVIVPPAELWAVADYGMTGLLTPILLELKEAETPQELAVYRPVAAQWDHMMVTVRDGDGFRLVGLSEEDGTQTTLVLDAGSLLYSERPTPDGLSQQIPTVERQARLQELLDRIQAGG